MKSTEIREKFLKYFESEGHTRVGSSSLIPSHDPTLLFTNAGMNQFKKIFVGQEKAKYKRAVSAQKCMRAGGKHNDLENVGQTARHHTFFEMLGNFSFGDYFKKEAVGYAWEFCLKELQLPKEKLYVTIYEKDDEAERLWLATDPFLKGRIYRFGEKDNFWSMGEAGPCGPCSEIIYDQGKEYGCGKPGCKIGCECDRYLELWNLVFMQYDRDEKGKMNPLPAPSVDTGMGLERTAAILQGTKSNYETDAFLPVIKKVESLCGKKCTDGENRISFRVIADHIRALTFCIADGIIPSNEGRGYVVRRILRRAARHGRLLKLPSPFLNQLTEEVIKSLGTVYPEIEIQKKQIDLVLKSEEENFERTLDRGIELFEEIASKTKKGKSKIMPGEEVFKLYDTYGFPPDLTEVMAREKGLNVDVTGFEKELEKQRERSKTGKFIMGAEGIPSGETFGTPKVIRGTRFVGYEKMEENSVVEEVWTSPQGEKYLVLEITPFYAEAGGQVGDTGKMKSPDREYLVTDTQRESDVILHRVEQAELDSTVRGAQVKAQVDKIRRRVIMRNHTVTHLLHKALRDILGEHVRQAGSLVAPDRMRFDFTHFKGLESDMLDRVESEVNQRILENYDVTPIPDVPFNEAKNMGAMALFGEKYGDRVRVINIGNYSLELCGGTHVRTTGEIGLFRITQETSVASGVRRIEALTGEEAIKVIRQERNMLVHGAKLLKTDTSNYIRKLESVVEMYKKYEQKLKKEEEENRNMAVQKRWHETTEQIYGVKYFTWDVGKVEHQNELKVFADNFSPFANSPAVGTISAHVGNQIAIMTFSTSSAINQHQLKANEILREQLDLAGSKGGGGNPRIAMGGLGSEEQLKKVNEALPEILRKKLEE